jgi:DNA-binding transcriptional MocR family regulator
MPLDLISQWKLLGAWVRAEPSLTACEFKVMFRLLDHQNPKTGLCNPSERTLADAVNCTERHVRNCITNLKKRGAIIVSRPRFLKTNQYEFRYPMMSNTTLELHTRNCSSKQQEPEFRNDRNSSSSKKEKEKEKKNEGHEVTVNSPNRIDLRRQALKVDLKIKDRAKEEKKFHNMITMRLEQNGLAYEDLLEVDNVLLDETFQRLLDEKISLSQAVDTILRTFL